MTDNEGLDPRNLTFSQAQGYEAASRARLRSKNLAMKPENPAMGSFG